MFDDLEQYESRVYSQNGEDGVLQRIFELVGETNRYFVEFGTGPLGLERNTRLLEENGWSGLLMDATAPERHPRVRRERITAENINELFVKYQVPEQFDLLSIDIDGIDYWVFRAIENRYRPRVLVMEYNAGLGAVERRTIKYDPDFAWSGTDYFGASLPALAAVADEKGYKLIYCDVRGINSYWVQADLAANWNRSVEKIFRPPNYARGKMFGLAQLYWRPGRGYRKDKTRETILV